MAVMQLKSRFHVLSFVLLAACVVGTPYAFGIFSLIFRRSLGYTQLDLSVVSSCGSTGLYTGVICGLGIERFGPVRVLQCGAFLIFLGNIYIWLAVQKLVWYGVAPVSCAYILAQMGTACATNVALVVSIRLFPPEVTGQTAGLSKGYFGASSAVLATVAACFFHLPSSGFILFVALTLPIVLLSASCNTNFLPEHLISFSYEEAGGWSPSLAPYVRHLLLVFACIISIGASQHFLDLTQPVSVFLGSLLCLAVLSILLLPSLNKGPRNLIISVSSDIDVSCCYGALSCAHQYKQLDSSLGGLDVSAPTHLKPQHYQSVVMSSPIESQTTDSTTLELGNYTPFSFNEARQDDSSTRHIIDTLHTAFTYSDTDDDADDVEVELFFNNDCPKSDMDNQYDGPVFISFYGRHLPLCESLRTWRLYAIMVVFCIVAGSGILVINNIQAVAEAVDQQPSAFFVTVISIANAGGRLMVGLVADASSDVLSRFQLLALISLLMAITQLLLSFGNALLLYPSLLMTGAMFGATFSNIAAITADVFGSKHVGSNYGFIDLAPAFGAYIFSAGLVAIYYPHSGDYRGTLSHSDLDQTQEQKGDYSTADFCRGAHCFRGAFVVTTCACLLAAFLSYFLHLTTLMKK